MTIALGVLGPDGVVIAADTQESFGYAGGAKVSGYKVWSRVLDRQGRAISITGAGSAGHLDALSQQLIDGFVRERSWSKLPTRLQRIVRRFHEDHLKPLHTLPKDLIPDVEVIIGATWKRERPILLASQNLTLRRCKGACPIRC